ncbi:MAG TPA: DEAD/DEAH box helicase family protein [Anaerolineales bacterium]|jgi:type III restriction enzyme|nr:DEAD/DEAH box helicase family protein [Anaerolineales bacterium]
MFTLKKYQNDTLDFLRQFLEEARFGNHPAAFERFQTESAKRAAPNPYRSLPELEDAPYVCLRLPTGGGKTLLGAHTISVAAQAFLEQDFPLVLWLVPTNTIRQQTLETLKNPRHPNREAITQKFGSQVLVLDIADFTQIRPQDIKSKAVIVVGTMQTLRVDNTEGRKVYAHHEDLEPHFVNIPKTLEGLEKIEEGAGKGTIKFSFRNLLALHRPLVIVDEAHNATSKLSVEVMQRIRPACIVEFTATPANNSNILHSVSASELKAADMIKLPVVLTEHQTWQEAITAAVQTREKLQKITTNERDYVHPIVLFQAEDKGHDITFEVVLNYLLDQEKIPRERIAIATGNQRELDGVNLLDPNNKVDFVITVEALKEGWDCPFAYVFCSVARVHSKKDIEQILGRVLRMPYAKKRVQEELNRAYAHVSEDSWKNAVSELQDRMVSMGFEEQEAQQSILPQPRLPFVEEETGQLPLTEQPTVKVILSASPDLSVFTPNELSQITTNQIGENEVEYKVTGAISSEFAEKLVNAAPKKDREVVEKTIAVQQAQQPKTPSQRGEKFIVPQLCMFVDGEWEVASKSWFLDARDWDLLKYPAELSEIEFSIKEEADTWLIDVQGKHLTTKYLGSETLFDLSDAPTNWTIGQLSQDLERKVRQDFVRPQVLLEYLRRTVSYLNEKRKIPLSDLVRARFILEKALRDKVKANYADAMAKGYQARLFGKEAAVETKFDNYTFEFPTDPFLYPAHGYYKGRYIWNKHYYPYVGELDSDPNDEEFLCAQAIDRNMAIRCWVRNIPKSDYSFKLPTSTDYFYPDYVALLNDGRILVVEYKGKPYETNDDSKEKMSIGELWESKSNRKGLFLFAVKRDAKGRDIYRQIEDKINGKY